MLSRQGFLIEALSEDCCLFGLYACRQLKVPLYLWIGLDVHPIYWS